MSISLISFWWHVEFEVPYVLEETLVWKLEDLGINSFAIEFSPDNSEIHNFSIWMPSNEWNFQDIEELTSCFKSLAKTFGINLKPPKCKKIEDIDWNIIWRKYWESDPIGNSILILPAWMECPIDFSDRQVIRIDPGCAFGTGSHPTTRLCLESLDRDPPENFVIADIGCGSGILSLTALCLGAKRVFAVDTDSFAVNSTRNNFLLNNLKKDSLLVFHGSINTLYSELKLEKVDLLLCNILLPIIKKLAFDFEKVLKSNGKALLSGILVEQIPELSDCLNSFGWKVCNSFEKDNWALLEIRRA